MMGLTIPVEVPITTILLVTAYNTILLYPAIHSSNHSSIRYYQIAHSSRMLQYNTHTEDRLGIRLSSMVDKQADGL